MMRLLTLCTGLIFIFAMTTAFAHKDRIEKPKSYRFTFLGGQTIILDNTNASLTTYCNDITNGKRKLLTAELTFGTGEVLTFESDGDKWKGIKISYGKRQFIIPELTIKKIPAVHFATVALLWDGLDERAFSASYFYIEFDIGVEKSFNVYPQLHLSFSGNEFSKSIVWKQVSRNSKQWTEF